MPRNLESEALIASPSIGNTTIELSSSSSSLSASASSSLYNYTSTNNANEANLDTNMVIILAALLCALIGAVGVNSIVRCALRCSRRFAMESAEEAAARLASTGLKKSHLRQIPVAVYGSGGGGHDGEFEGTECPICLGEFADGDKLRVLPECKHRFHVRCIDTWFASHSCCPICRHSLLHDKHQLPLTNSVNSNASSGEHQAASTTTPFVIVMGAGTS